MDFLEELLKERHLCPLGGMEHQPEGWSFSSHSGAEGTMHGSHGLDSTAERPCSVEMLHKPCLPALYSGSRVKQVLLFNLLLFEIFYCSQLHAILNVHP